jgi:hypothetical protein
MLGFCLKIAYVVGGNLSSTSGVTKKILAAALEWAGLGHSVVIVAYGESRVISKVAEFVALDPKQRIGNKVSFAFSLFQQYGFLRSSLEEIQPDIVYGRYPFPLWFPEKAYGCCCPFVLEINTDDFVEYGLSSKFKGFLNRAFRSLTIKAASGLVFVTEELQDSRSFSFFKGPVVTIGNPCLPPFIATKAPENHKLTFGFAGSPGQSWHGIDKIFELARRLKFAHFEIVGLDHDCVSHASSQAPANVEFLGRLKGNELDRKLEGWDVGICSLALHRNQMKDACPLKSRLYMSRGLPMVYAYNDPDLDGSEVFALKISNSDHNIIENWNAIHRFALSVKQDRFMRGRAVQFAEKNLSLKAKETKRLKFLTQILGAFDEEHLKVSGGSREL